MKMLILQAVVSALFMSYLNPATGESMCVCVCVCERERERERERYLPNSTQQGSHHARMEMRDLWEVAATLKDVWKCAVMDLGVVSVTMNGRPLMLMYFADNLDTLVRVKLSPIRTANSYTEYGIKDNVHLQCITLS